MDGCHCGFAEVEDLVLEFGGEVGEVCHCDVMMIFVLEGCGWL